MTIPVFIVPVISRFDLLERMLRSIDEPIERGLIVDNARSDYQRPDWAPPELGVYAPPFDSLGWAGSLNFGIGQTPDAPWWFWSSNDIVFGEGDLAKITEYMESATEARIVTFDYAWGAFNQAVAQQVGLFDEWNYWPIYYDDTDFDYRCRLAKIDRIRYTGNIKHGAGDHQTSLTVASSESFAKANGITYALNYKAYAEKWGGPPGEERFTTPWGQAWPLWATRPDLEARAARTWR